jgi:hypothetical protein
MSQRLTASPAARLLSGAGFAYSGGWYFADGAKEAAPA